MENVTNSDNIYGVLDKKTANPASVYAMLNTTTRTRTPEGSPPKRSLLSVPVTVWIPLKIQQEESYKDQ